MNANASYKGMKLSKTVKDFHAESYYQHLEYRQIYTAISAIAVNKLGALCVPKNATLNVHSLLLIVLFKNIAFGDTFTVVLISMNFIVKCFKCDKW